MRRATLILRLVARPSTLWVFSIRNLTVIGAIGIILLYTFALLAVWKGPEMLLADWEARLDPKDFVQQMNNLRTALVQVFGGAFVLIGIVIAWRRLEVARQGQITERFTRAIDQLGSTHPSDGSPNLEVRLGGIYALERIARDSERDHWPIVEVLTAYVREHRPWPPPASGGQSTANEPSPRAALSPAAKPSHRPCPKTSRRSSPSSGGAGGHTEGERCSAWIYAERTCGAPTSLTPIWRGRTSWKPIWRGRTSGEPIWRGLSYGPPASPGSRSQGPSQMRIPSSRSTRGSLHRNKPAKREIKAFKEEME